MAKNFQGQSTLPIGLRNNNPGNIRPGDNWRGSIGSNGGFIVFENCSWGLRAMAIDLKNKIGKGYNTVSKIISRWAPPSENNTAAYINSVVSSTGFGANQVLTANATTIAKLIRAIVTVELGAKYAAMLTDLDINEGISLAGIAGGSANSSAGAMGVIVLAAAIGLAAHYKLF